VPDRPRRLLLCRQPASVTPFTCRAASWPGPTGSTPRCRPTEPGQRGARGGRTFSAGTGSLRRPSGRHSGRSLGWPHRSPGVVGALSRRPPGR
jgi:hypothetical protein